MSAEPSSRGHAARATRRRLLAPEVIQTSAMDCGPASLKCLLEGFGIVASYGRLREACQTEVDGSSIDTLEDVAIELGLDAEQTMLPADWLLLEEAAALPALVIVRLPTGFTHFVVAWRVHGPFVQVMDPAAGRRWLTARRFLSDLYLHEMRIPCADWEQWARGDGFTAPLARRLGTIVPGARAAQLVAEARRAAGWRPLARLDAATRLVGSLVEGRGIARGAQADRALAGFIERATQDGDAIPARFWSAREVEREPTRDGGDGVVDHDQDGEAVDGAKMLLLRGAVLLRVRGRHVRAGEKAGSVAEGSEGRRTDADAKTAAPDVASGIVYAAAGVGDAGPATKPRAARRELEAATTERPPRPLRELARLGRGGSGLPAGAIALGILGSAAAIVVESVLLRGIIDVGRDLGLVTQRLEAVGTFVLFALVVTAIELGVLSGLASLGRRIETSLRMAFLEKLPRLSDRYFSSRPVSDMAERAHSAHQLRALPRMAGQLARAIAGLVLVAGAIVWIHPGGAPWALLAVLLAVGMPLFFQPHLQELDLRLRTHAGGLARFTLDALMGLAAIRAHGAGRSVRREHEGLLVEWGATQHQLLRTGVLLEGLQSLGGLGCAVLLLFSYASRDGDASGALLLAYWSLCLPALGEEIALLVRQYPIHRTLTLRMLEPLGAPEGEEARPTDSGDLASHDRPLDRLAKRKRVKGAQMGGKATSAIAVELREVRVVASGHTILDGVDLSVTGGSHVAIVGESGAGKSSLVGLLLGWHRASSGQVLVDGEPLDPARRDTLLPSVVWIDPSVQLWNRSLLDNLLYGAGVERRFDPGDVVANADLEGLLPHLERGLQTPLGEGGGLLSGGEGQRVRLGRGFARQRPRLIILDEPFRGLDRQTRKILLDRARSRWRSATLLCITHDVAETRGFERVLVVEGGRVVEDGSPEALLADVESRYRRLHDAERAVLADVWGRGEWRRMRLEDGALRESGGGAP